MICSSNTNVSLPYTYGATNPLPGIALAPIVSEEARIGQLFEQASSALGFALNQTQSYKEIEDRLLGHLMGCDLNPRYHKAWRLMPSGRCGGEGLDKTIEEVRILLGYICRSRPTTGCEEKKFISKEIFTESLYLQVEDLVRIEESFGSNDPENSEMVAIGRELLDLQRKFSDSDYLFSHGMSRLHASLPKLITDLDHRLWPKRDSKDFIFVRVVPPAKPMTELHKIFHEVGRKDDHELRKELLCADADLVNMNPLESALFYYRKDYNIFRNIPWIVCDILTNFAEEFGMDFPMKKCESDWVADWRELFDRTMNFWDHWEIGRKRVYGALLVYAVPKTLIHNPNTNLVYTSYSMGRPVDQENPLAKLEEMTAGQHQDTDMSMSVRLLTSHLRPELGIRAFWVGERTDQDHLTVRLTELGWMDKQRWSDKVEWSAKLSTIADSFFNKVLQHCHAESAPDFLGAKNAECERLLRETAAGTEAVGVERLN
jgi:hypothetical protein